MEGIEADSAASRSGDPHEIRRIAPGTRDWSLALHMAMELPAPRGDSIHALVSDLLGSVESGCACIDLTYGAYAGGRLVASALIVEAAGGAAMVMAGGDSTPPAEDGAVKALVAARDAAWPRGNRVLEALLPPDDPDKASVYRRGGMRFLTTLLYHTRLCEGSESHPQPATDLGFQTYSAESEAAFAAALEQSYAQSLDCPELAGLRSTHDILRTHRARREFDPDLWWVAMREDRPVGLALLNRLPDGTGVEIVYLGVAQPSRRSGVAHALLARTFAATRRMNAKYVALAVDRRNTSARRMYERWGFVRTLSRDAFFATPPTA